MQVIISNIDDNNKQLFVSVLENGCCLFSFMIMTETYRQNKNGLQRYTELRLDMRFSYMSHGITEFYHSVQYMPMVQ